MSILSVLANGRFPGQSRVAPWTNFRVTDPEDDALLKLFCMQQAREE
jgi:hypothetical protein